MPTDKKKLPNNIINPFSETFLEKWQLWKDYRWEEHKFKYKGVISEQARLMQLCTLSGGKEDVAIKIIMQSIENTWSGFYQVQENNNNGTYTGNKGNFTDKTIPQSIAKGSFGNL